MSKPLVIFDLDGTLLDSLGDLADAVNHTLLQANLPTHTTAEYRTFVGWGADHLIHKALPAGHSEDLFGQVRAAYDTVYMAVCRSGCTKFPGVDALLEGLHRAGVLTGVVSNKPHNQTEAIAHSTFGTLLDGWLGQQSAIPIKPDPAGIHLLSQRLGAQCLAYVGDSNVDIETGLNAKIPTVGVSWGMQPRQLLLDAGATVIADDLPRLEQILLDIIANKP